MRRTANLASDRSECPPAAAGERFSLFFEKISARERCGLGGLQKNDYFCGQQKSTFIMSFINERVQPEGLTFDDVLLVPAYSEVLPLSLIHI